jgi:SWI/SNF-related matrix-associated actin-dependent regulator of chromatin subfamily A member 5
MNADTPSDPNNEPPPDDDSDVEMEGVDIDEEAEDTTEDHAAATSSGDNAAEIENEDEISALATAEATEMEEARKEQQELIAAEQKRAADLHERAPASAQERLEYLMGQSDVFAHFLAGSVASTTKKGKKGSRGKKNRLTEAEEDEQMLKSAQSKRRVIRLDKQPSNLASHCNMHPYQLEGLNWLIKLHDHGINGILAGKYKRIGRKFGICFFVLSSNCGSLLHFLQTKWAWAKLCRFVHQDYI